MRDLLAVRSVRHAPEGRGRRSILLLPGMVRDAVSVARTGAKPGRAPLVQCRPVDHGRRRAIWCESVKRAHNALGTSERGFLHWVRALQMSGGSAYQPRGDSLDQCAAVRKCGAGDAGHVGDWLLPVHDVGGRGRRHGVRAAVRQRHRPIVLVQRPAVSETVISQARFFECQRAGSLIGRAMRRGPCPLHIVVETTHPVRGASASVRTVAQLCQRSRE